MAMKPYLLGFGIALVGIAWLASIAVQLVFLAGLAGVPLLIGALVVQLVIVALVSGLLLTTNTRRPAGIDPNILVRSTDPFSLTTDELQRGIKLPDDRHYGRRAKDDLAVVERLIRRFESEDATRPPPATTPDWATELLQEHDEEKTD